MLGNALRGFVDEDNNIVDVVDVDDVDVIVDDDEDDEDDVVLWR